jgi:Nucleotidyltransferase domain
MVEIRYLPPAAIVWLVSLTFGPPLLGELRDRLLDQVLGLLEADLAVAGVALIGSLGRGEADNWSDADLLVLMGNRALARFKDEPAASPWAQADLLVDGRHNSPAGAMSVGATHLRSGLPVRVDLHVHPVARTPWPIDGRVVLERRPIEAGTWSFDQLNTDGPRQPAVAKTSAEIRKIHLSYVPTAGKYVGRRSPRAREMIRFLGRNSDDDIRDPAAQLLALREIAVGLSDPSWAWLSAAVASYLDLVEATLSL